jgi:hypothetical protein
MASISLVQIKLPADPVDPEDASRKAYVDAEIVRTATVAGAGLALNADGKTFDVVAADGSILVDIDNIAVGSKGITTAHLADGAVTNLQSAVTLGGLNNVDISADSPTTAGDVLSWDGLEWTAVPLPAATVITAGAGLLDTADTFSVVSAADGSVIVGADVSVAPKGITAAHIAYGAVGNAESSVTLGGLNNVNISVDAGRTAGDLLTWGGAEWSAAPAVATVYVAGAGLVETTTGTFDIGAGSGITVAADTIAADPAIVQLRSEKGVADGYAPLDAGNLIPSIHLPSLNVSDITVVTDDAARLAQTGLGVGDVTVQTVDSTAWIVLDATDLSLPASWSQITNTGTVTTVNGLPGPTVVLDAASVGAAAETTTLTAGAGLTGGGDLTTARTFDVAAGTGISVAADAVSLDTAFTDTLYSPVTHAHALDDLSDVDTVTVAPASGNHLVYNGTAWAPAAAGVAVAKHSEDIGGATTAVVTHNLGTLDIVASVREIATNDMVNCNIQATSINTATFGFDVAPAAASLRVVIVG